MTITDLGNRIREQREKLALTQHDIAHALQVSPQAVSKWERGENAPDIASILPLARLLGVSTDHLLGNTMETREVFEATVFVSDVAGFTQSSQTMKPEEAADWLNGMFYQVTEAVLRYDGVPVKYIGDSFLCFFSGSNHQHRAVAAAWHARKIMSADVRFALSCGRIRVGSVGHPDYARTDIIGDCINTAFRLSAAAVKKTQSGIAATGGVAEHLEAAAVKQISVALKGIPEAVKLYEILAGE